MRGSFKGSGYDLPFMTFGEKISYGVFFLLLLIFSIFIIYNCID